MITAGRLRLLRLQRVPTKWANTNSATSTRTRADVEQIASAFHFQVDEEDGLRTGTGSDIQALMLFSATPVQVRSFRARSSIAVRVPCPPISQSSSPRSASIVRSWSVTSTYPLIGELRKPIR